MDSKIVIGAVAVIAICVVAAAILMTGGGGSKDVDHSLDTEMTVTNEWNIIDGWDEKYKFIDNGDKIVDDYSDKQATLISGSLPPGVKAYVSTSAYGLHVWVFDSYDSTLTKQGGTWSGTLKFTVDNDSKYDGTEHLIHFTLTRSAW